MARSSGPESSLSREELLAVLREREALQAGQKEALQAALNGAPLETSLGVLVRVTVEHFGPETRAVFYFSDPAGTEPHHIVGLPADYGEQVSRFKIGPESLAWGFATHTGEPVLTTDVREEPRGQPCWQPWQWLAERFDYRGCWTFPIHTSAGMFVGTLAIYSREPREATPRDVEFASFLTETASIIISRHIEAEERKKAEGALRESEQRFRMLFELGPVAVYSCDTSGVIREFNRRAAELWGRTPALGDTDERFCGSFKMFRPDGTYMPHDRCPMAEVLTGALPFVHDGEVHIERPDGSRVVVIVSIRPLKNQQGEITGAVNCFYDITERKQAEEALKEDDRRKDEFLAMLAHELRNPLAPIRNAVQVMRLADGNREAVASASEIMDRQVGQLVRLVDDLLDVSRIRLGKIELRRAPVSLASIVDHATEATRPLCESKGLKLTVALPPKPIILDADPTRMAQVMGNLLNNACKFNVHGGRVWLTAERDGEQAVIRVRDTGIGIAAEQFPRIFDMFTQVDTSLERSASGLGIGLTLVKNLVEMHDGTVEVHSGGIGQGSEVLVRLPIVSADVSPEPPVSEPGRMTTRRILVVDDNRDSAESLAMMLELTGNQTHVAYDGLEAVEAAARIKPDAILLDIGLPKLNGYEVCSRIREQPWGKDIVLLALTGWGQEEDRQKSSAAGFDGHLVKPVDHAVLMKSLSEVDGRY